MGGEAAGDADGGPAEPGLAWRSTRSACSPASCWRLACRTAALVAMFR